MQFPFDGDDASDPELGRFPRILTVGLACVSLLGLVGLWYLLPHRHEVVPEPDVVNSSTDALAKEPDRNGPELTPIAAPSNPPAPKTAVNKRTRPARSKPTLAGSTTPSDTLPTEKNKPIVPTGNVVIQHVGAGASAYMIQPTSDGGFDRWWVDAYGSIYNKEHVDKYGRARTAADWRGH